MPRRFQRGIARPWGGPGSVSSRQSEFRLVPGRFPVGRVCSAMSRVDFRSVEGVPPCPGSISCLQSVFRVYLGVIWALLIFAHLCTSVHICGHQTPNYFINIDTLSMMQLFELRKLLKWPQLDLHEKFITLKKIHQKDKNVKIIYLFYCNFLKMT